MTEIKVFIAGSKSLTRERDAIRSVLQILSNSNTKKLLIRTYTYEEFDTSLSLEGRQKEYNRFIMNEADYVIFVLDGTIGGITLEEFDVAWKTFTSKKRPGIYVYHKPTATISKEIQKVIDKINQCGQYYTEYSNIENLKLKVENSFHRIILEALLKKWMGYAILGVLVILAIVGINFLKNKSIRREPANMVEKASSYKETTSAVTSYEYHEYVDLGLSVKWATCNVGASSPIEHGNTFSWGETIEGKNHNWESYKYSRDESSYITKYCDNETIGVVDRKTKLELSDDAANLKWGPNWRIPTKIEFEELMNKCSWKKEKIDEVEGFRVVGKNGNSIFLPFNGFITHEKKLDGHNVLINRKIHVAENGSGYYWTSSLDVNNPKMAWGFVINPNTQGMNIYERYCGLYIRPVCIKK